MSFIAHIDACNRWEPSAFMPLILAGERVGWVRPEFAEYLTQLSSDFVLEQQCCCWQQAPADFDQRSAVMAQLCQQLQRDGWVPQLHGELYPVTPNERHQARLVIDRGCAPCFGVRAFGQHLNGYVRTANGLALWVPRRAADRRHYPDHYDNTVAGGLPWGLSLRANLAKECWEEASIPATLAEQARSVSAISYCHATERGLKPDVMYCYDLELPADFIPQCNDDEVAGFELWSIEQVMDRVRTTTQFKLNCNLVIIDFLIRHGLIDPDTPEYLTLITRLRSPLP